MRSFCRQGGLKGNTARRAAAHLDHGRTQNWRRRCSTCGTRRWPQVKRRESSAYRTTRCWCTSAASMGRASSLSSWGKIVSAGPSTYSTWTPATTTTTIPRASTSTRRKTTRTRAKDPRAPNPTSLLIQCSTRSRKGFIPSSPPAFRCLWTCCTSSRPMRRQGSCTNRCRWPWTRCREWRKRRIAKAIGRRRIRQTRRATRTARPRTRRTRPTTARSCTTTGKTNSSTCSVFSWNVFDVSCTFNCVSKQAYSSSFRALYYGRNLA